VERAFYPTSLIHMRKERGWSQEELARRSGLATVTVVKLEQGKVADPHVSTLARLASAMGCQIEAFLLDEDMSSAGATAGGPEHEEPSTT
jgi:transcriptional regulator with XRE-family HTH domain